jgi:catechol 2,3-dioxygenase-like lactoylglutathione lyase family enzyme
MTSSEDENWAALVPELLVTDLDGALSFYRDLCGFRVRYGRPEDGFAYLELGQAQLMLEELDEGSWLTGALDAPFGRGLNLQIEVEDLAGLAARLEAAGRPLFRPIATEWYRQDDVEHGQRQFLVQDPDGYLLRFVQPLGTRPAQDVPRS